MAQYNVSDSITQQALSASADSITAVWLSGSSVWLTLFLLIFTLVVYALAVWLYKRTRFALLHPLLSSAAVIIVLLMVMGVDYERYKNATQIIDFMLGPTVVALGYTLYCQREELWRYRFSILTSVVVGSAVGIASVMGIVRMMDGSFALEASLVPKSVTTPIAMSIAGNNGGVVSLTAVVVILTGIFGGIIGPAILRRLGITSPIARGLALGCSAHGVGTAQALTLGAIEGAISGLAIALMGLVTALLVPLFGLIR